MGLGKIEKSQIKKYLKELRLPGIREYFDEYIRLAIKDSISYEQFFLGLLEYESEYRYESRISRYLRQSGLPSEKRMDTFDLKRLPFKINQLVKTLTAGDFINRHENVLVFGVPGSGKTHLLCALGHELIKQNKRVLFTTCSILVQELLIAKRDLLLAKKLSKLSKFEAIIIDDIGYVQQSREEMEVLFTLLADRYERSSIMLTSNLPFSKWEVIFKDPMVTAAAIDRLVHHSIILELNMPSYRMEYAKNSKQGAKED
jgi:DNA replication protein DnaC